MQLWIIKKKKKQKFVKTIASKKNEISREKRKKPKTKNLDMNSKTCKLRVIKGRLNVDLLKWTLNPHLYPLCPIISNNIFFFPRLLLLFYLKLWNLGRPWMTVVHYDEITYFDISYFLDLRRNDGFWHIIFLGLSSLFTSTYFQRLHNI